MELTIKVKIKTKTAKPIEIDREIRTLLRGNLETAVEDILNDVPFNYNCETDLICLKITN